MYAVSMYVLGVHLLQQHAAFDLIVTTYIVQNSTLEVSTCVRFLELKKNYIYTTCIQSQQRVVYSDCNVFEDAYRYAILTHSILRLLFDDMFAQINIASKMRNKVCTCNKSRYSYT
jgi:hypothetical protein